VRIKIASYNIHKAIGLDRRRDPERILAVLREIDADVVALQEADRRFGARAAVLPLSAIAALSPYKPVPLSIRADSIGWHGNALLVRRDIAIAEAHRVPLPTIEPRGAIAADLTVAGQGMRVVGMHLDLSGLRRRQQVRAVLHHLAARGTAAPTVLMGDFNEWSAAGCLREFGHDWRVLACGRSFPARRPLGQLDRVVVSRGWRVVSAGVHHSALAAVASDHLPVWACLDLAAPE